MEVLQVTQSLNKAILANPYVAVAVALAALVAGIAVYIKSTSDEENAVRDLNEVSEERLRLAKETARVYFNAEQTLAQLTAAAKSNNTTIAEEAKLRKDNAQAAIREAENTLNSINFKEREGIITAELAATERERFTISRDEAKKYYDQIVAAEVLYTTKQGEEVSKRTEASKDAKLEYEGFLQTDNRQLRRLLNHFLFKLDNDLDKPLEELEEIFDDLGDTIFFTKENLTNLIELQR
jgi:GH18 family chitinase